MARTPSHLLLLLAFAFTVMADPISSVAYAIEAALRALNGQLGLLLPTMALVVAVIGLVTLNYHYLIARFPEGGGAAAAAGAALGEAWAFVPIGALVVDFVLTISISIAASSAAIIAYFPALANDRVPLALGLLLLVGGLSSFGHGGRIVFALMTLAFVGISTVLLTVGWLQVASNTALPSTGSVLSTAAPLSTSIPSAPSAPGGALLSVLLAFPVAMALATGVEAPSSAIAQLGQLDTSGRRRFGQITLWLTLFIVGGLDAGSHRAGRASRHWIAPGEQHRDCRSGPRCGKQWPVRGISGSNCDPAPGGGQFLVSGRARSPQGACSSPGRRHSQWWDPAFVARAHEPPSYSLLGPSCISPDRSRGINVVRGSGSGARIVLCGRCVSQLSDWVAGHGISCPGSTWPSVD